MENKPIKGELPVLTEIDYDVRRSEWQNGEIKVLDIEDVSNMCYPEYFKANDFAILFITQGSLSGQLNHTDEHISTPAAMYISNNHVLHYIRNTPDLKVRILSFSPMIAKDITLSIRKDILRYVYMRPVVSFEAEVMQTIMHYLDLLEELTRHDHEKLRPVIVQFLQSLINFLLIYYAGIIPFQKPLTRVEDIAGRFLSLVDAHCTKHHDINWYANELHLSPKYIMYVVKKVTRMSAGKCISEQLAHQAKSLLLTSSLSIQQISDQLGFQNQSHFGTFFRREAGVSPREFRNHHHSSPQRG